MGTRVCSCVRVRSRAGADDAIIRGMCASAAPSLRKAIHRWYSIYRYMMHACIYIHARLATQKNGSPVRARRTHAPTCCVRASVRACVCDWAAAPSRASAIRRCGPRAARLAGVPLGVCVQRGHWRMDHRVCVEHAVGMRRLFGHGRRATAGRTRSAGRPCVAGRFCAAAPPTRVCMRRRVATRMRGRPRV
jgi:hypothetical protein